MLWYNKNVLFSIFMFLYDNLDEKYKLMYEKDILSLTSSLEKREVTKEKKKWMKLLSKKKRIKVPLYYGMIVSLGFSGFFLFFFM